MRIRDDGDVLARGEHRRGTLSLTAAGWSSLVARRAHNPKVAGSNPAPATKKALVRVLLGQGFLVSGPELLTNLLTSSNVKRPVRGGTGWHDPVSDRMEQG